jgi:hypothetical protein
VRGYLRPFLGAANPILEKQGRINPTSPVSLMTFGQLNDQFQLIECAHYL